MCEKCVKEEKEEEVILQIWTEYNVERREREVAFILWFVHVFTFIIHVDATRDVPND